MTALSAPRDTWEADGVSIQPVVKSGSVIYRGAHVGINTSGTAQPMAKAVSGGLRSVGVALETVTGDGVLTVKCRAGSFAFHNSSSSDEITIEDVGAVAYFEDDQTAALLSTGSRPQGGRIVDVLEDGKVVVATGIINALDGDLVAANNLSDVTVAATARANIGANKGAYTFEKISSKAADAEVARIVADRAGTITGFKTVLNGALATGDATVQLKINGSNVGSTTTGLITQTQSGSAAGDVDTATPLTTNLTFVAGDVISVTAGGASTATATFNTTIAFTY